MTSLFSTVNSKLAHTSKLPLGPKDFKPLGDLIASEKSVLNDHARLSLDLKKSSDALREWGVSEGADLGDPLTKLASLFDHLSSAESKFAHHEATYRMLFKALRSREENFSQLRKNKDSLQGKIDALDRKLSKMSMEHKDRGTTSQKLVELREEMVGMDNAVINEDAKLSDFKRDTAREALNMKLGAIYELAERMTIISDMGKLLVGTIPAYRKDPRGERPQYSGYDETTRIVTEAEQCLQGVIFNAGTPATGGLQSELPLPEHPNDTSLESPRIDFDRDITTTPGFSTQHNNPAAATSSGNDSRIGSEEPTLPRVELETEYPVAQAFAQENYTSPELYRPLTTPDPRDPRASSVSSAGLPKPPRAFVAHERDQYQYDYDESNFYVRNNAVAVHGEPNYQESENVGDNQRPARDLSQESTSELLDNVADNLLGRQGTSPSESNVDQKVSAGAFRRTPQSSPYREFPNPLGSYSSNVTSKPSRPITTAFSSNNIYNAAPVEDGMAGGSGQWDPSAYRNTEDNIEQWKEATAEGSVGSVSSRRGPLPPTPTVPVGNPNSLPSSPAMNSRSELPYSPSHMEEENNVTSTPPLRWAKRSSFFMPPAVPAGAYTSPASSNPPPQMQSPSPQISQQSTSPSQHGAQQQPPPSHDKEEVSEQPARISVESHSTLPPPAYGEHNNPSTDHNGSPTTAGTPGYNSRLYVTNLD